MGKKWADLTEEERQRKRDFNRRYYENNRAKYKAQAKAWRAANPERARGISYASEKRHRARRIIYSTRLRARKQGVPYTITKQDIEKHLAPMTCAVTGVQLGWDLGPFTPSIDRIIPEHGYTPENIRIVCFAYNCFKNAWTDAECRFIARALVERAAPHGPNSGPGQTDPLKVQEPEQPAHHQEDWVQMFLPGLGPEER